MNTTRTLWIGRILTGLAILFFLMDAGGKLIAPATMIANSPPLGLPATVEFYRLLGTIALLCTALHAWPKTSMLGAVLLTGYLGGAIACQLRVGSPVFSHTLFGVYIGLFVWGGLWLRDARLRAIFPVIRQTIQEKGERR